MNTCLLQLTDSHVCMPGTRLYGRVDTARMLDTAVTAVLNLKQAPAAVVITSDLAESGAAAEYEVAARAIRRLPMPVYLMPGNHDDREQLRKSFPDHAYLGTGTYLQYAAALGDMRLICLDTVVPGQPHGELDDARMSWLAEQLERYQDETVILAMHHPPFATLIGHMDKMGLLQGAPELEKLVASYPNVARVICGHMHRAIDIGFAGTIASVAPSTAHQIPADLDPDAPAMWNLEPPGFRLHVRTHEGRVVTHTVYSNQYPGPYFFA